MLGCYAAHSLVMHFLSRIKNVARCRDSRLAKQGRDDSVKQFSIQPHPTYLSTLKICRVELCTELFYAIIDIPTLFLCFLLVYCPYISLHF